MGGDVLFAKGSAWGKLRLLARDKEDAGRAEIEVERGRRATAEAGRDTG